MISIQKISITGLLLLCSLYSKAQTGTDTIKVTVNGQTATIGNSGVGKKTTVSFEDSLYVFQISVIKLNKNNRPVSQDNIADQPSPPARVKSTRWFGEGAIGIFVQADQQFTRNSLENYQFYNFQSTNQASFYEMNSITLQPGIRFELFIKEKRRPWGKQGLNFITGLRFQYNICKGHANGNFNTYTLDSNNRVMPNAPISSYAANMEATFTNVRFCAPMLFEKQLKSKKNPLVFQGGVLIGFNTNISKIRQYSASPLFLSVSNFSRNVGYDGSSFISLQPTVRLLYKGRYSFNLTYDLSKSNYNFGSTETLTTHPFCFSMGYRFY